MGFVMPHITVVIGTGAVGLALILQIVGVATPGWIVVSAVDYGQGLWKVCGASNCVDYPSGSTFCAMIEFAVWAGEVSSALSDYLGYSFALTIVACLLSAAAAGLFFLGRIKGGA